MSECLSILKHRQMTCPQLLGQVIGNNPLNAMAKEKSIIILSDMTPIYVYVVKGFRTQGAVC